jgi:uncharacterized protein YukE
VSDPLGSLAERIQVELEELERVLARVQEGWQRARTSRDDYYLDRVALNLHSLYSGIERIFQRITETLDGTMPTGENWHQALLVQMTRDMPGMRPAVISADTCQRLSEYRGFRYIVRNIYTYRFDPAKIEQLVVDAPSTYARTRAELLALARFLDSESGGRRR